MRRRVQAGVEQFTFALNAEALTNFAYASYKKTHDVAVQPGQLYYAHRPMRSYYLCRLQLRRRGPGGQLVHVDGAHGAVDRRRHGHRPPAALPVRQRRHALFLHPEPAVRSLGSDPAAFQARVQQVSELMDDTNPDMSAFFARGELEDWVERGSSRPTSLSGSTANRCLPTAWWLPSPCAATRLIRGTLAPARPVPAWRATACVPQADRLPGAGRRQRTTSTGMLQWPSTLGVSLPRRSASRPCLPCEAMTIRSQ